LIGIKYSVQLINMTPPKEYLSLPTSLYRGADFDTAGIHHDSMILNNGQGKFNEYIRGICFWKKRVIYLRGHENENWLKATKTMVRKNGVSAHFRVIWGVDAATELANELRGL